MNNYFLAPRVIYTRHTARLGYPIYLRFRYKDDESLMATGIYIKDKKHWNDKIKRVIDGPNLKLKNQAIDKKMEDANARLLKAIVDGDVPNSSAFKGVVLKSFEAYILEICKNNVSVANGLVKAIKGCCTKVPDIGHISVRSLRLLEDYMFGVGLEQNSVKCYMGVMRKVLNQAVKEGYLAKSPIGPDGYRVPSSATTIPVYLVTEERSNLLQALLTNKFSGPLHMSLAYFMLGCYSGLRYIDWTTFDCNTKITFDKSLEKNMIVLQAQKNKTPITMPIHKGSPLEKVLSVIREIGPLTISYDRILQHLDALRKDMKLHKEITTHSARHSFGYMCAAGKMSKETTAYFMGITVKIVDVYYHLTGALAAEQSKVLAGAA